MLFTHKEKIKPCSNAVICTAKAYDYVAVIYTAKLCSIVVKYTAKSCCIVVKYTA